MRPLPVLLASLALAACSGPSARRSSPQESAGPPDHWEAVGIGAADPTLASDTQRKALSRDAAVVKARYRLRSTLRDAEVEGGGTLEEALHEEPSVEARLDAALADAEIAATAFTEDNGCIVTLRLSKRRVEARLGVRLK